jgi:hypothetical protein
MAYKGKSSISNSAPYASKLYNFHTSNAESYPPSGVDVLVTDNEDFIVDDNGDFIEVV